LGRRRGVLGRGGRKGDFCQMNAKDGEVGWPNLRHGENCFRNQGARSKEILPEREAEQRGAGGTQDKKLPLPATEGSPAQL